MNRIIAVAATAAVAATLTAAPFAVGGENEPHGRATPFTYAVIGDTPYGAPQIANFPNDVTEINADPDVSLVVHLGDIKNGSSRCDTSYFTTIRTAFDGFTDPLVYTPGDNEWTDCHRANNGGYTPTERLATIRQVFFDQPGHALGSPTMTVDAQAAPYVENVTWSRSRVQFGTVNVPGSNNDWLPWFGAAAPGTDQVAEYTGRNAANLAWLDHIFRQADENHAKAVVIGIQADMWDEAFSGPNDDPTQYDHFTDFVRRLARDAREFEKPVLLLNGDSHRFTDDRPLADAAKPYQRTMYGLTRTVPNLRRITTNGSTTPCHEWIKLSVDPRSKDVFTATRERFHKQPGFDPQVCPAA
jgi:hypothetical protein